jgi:hypothetical protein
MTNNLNPLNRLANFFNHEEKTQISSREPVVPRFFREMLLISAADAALDLVDKKAADATWEIAEAVFWVAAAAFIAYKKECANREFYQDLQNRLESLPQEDELVEIAQEDRTTSVPVSSNKPNTKLEYLTSSITDGLDKLILPTIATVSIFNFGGKVLMHQDDWIPSAAIALSCMAAIAYDKAREAHLNNKHKSYIANITQDHPTNNVDQQR